MPGTHLSKKFFLLRFGVGIMDKGHFFGWYAFGDQLVPQVVIHILKRSHIKNAFIIWRHFDWPVRSRCGQVAKDHLCGTPVGAMLSYLKYIVSTGVGLAGITVREQGIEHPLVKSQFASVVGDEQHIVHVAPHLFVSDEFGPF